LSIHFHVGREGLPKMGSWSPFWQHKPFFPAAQLLAWDLPHVNYTGADASPVRARIVADIERRQHIEITPAHRREMLRTPDALDAFIATFAGRAAANRTLKLEKPSSWKTEGAIAVHA
jgi:hypothetical protein